MSIATKKAMKKPNVAIKVKKTQFKKGTIPWNKGKTNVYSKETIEKLKQARLKQIYPKKNTSIEIIIFDILNKLELKFDKHKAIKNICQADAYIKPNIVIFADGDYWHCNPRRYKKPISEAQVKNIKRDILANKRLNELGFKVIRLWEFDLKNNPLKCENIIRKDCGDLNEKT